MAAVTEWWEYLVGQINPESRDVSRTVDEILVQLGVGS
jgi:hypothetical protein